MGEWALEVPLASRGVAFGAGRTGVATFFWRLAIAMESNWRVVWIVVRSKEGREGGK